MISGGVERLWRYGRLYAYFVRFSLSQSMEFRVDFLFRIFMDLVFVVVEIAFFFVLFRHTEMLAGWSLDQVLVFQSGILVIDALVMTFFADNLWTLPLMINQGQLDYYLVRPVSSLFFMTTRRLAVNSLVNLAVAFGVLTWALMRLDLAPSLPSIALYGVMLLGGALLFAMIELWFIVPLFWLQSPTGIRDLYYPVARLGERPHRMYRQGLRVVLTTVLPLAFMGSVPAAILFEGPRPLMLAAWLAALAYAALVTGLLWRLGLRSYASASS